MRIGVSVALLALLGLPAADSASLAGLVYHDADSDGAVTAVAPPSSSSSSFASPSRSELDAGVVGAPVTLLSCADPSDVVSTGESDVDGRIGGHSPVYEGGGRYALDAGAGAGGACSVTVAGDETGDVIGEGCYVAVSSPPGYEVTSTFPAVPPSCDGDGYSTDDGAAGTGGGYNVVSERIPGRSAGEYMRWVAPRRDVPPDELEEDDYSSDDPDGAASRGYRAALAGCVGYDPSARRWHALPGRDFTSDDASGDGAPPPPLPVTDEGDDVLVLPPLGMVRSEWPLSVRAGAEVYVGLEFEARDRYVRLPGGPDGDGGSAGGGGGPPDARFAFSPRRASPWQFRAPGGDATPRLPEEPPRDRWEGDPYRNYRHGSGRGVPSFRDLANLEDALGGFLRARLEEATPAGYELTDVEVALDGMWSLVEIEDRADGSIIAAGRRSIPSDEEVRGLRGRGRNSAPPGLFLTSTASDRAVAKVSADVGGAGLRGGPTSRSRSLARIAEPHLIYRLSVRARYLERDGATESRSAALSSDFGGTVSSALNSNREALVLSLRRRSGHGQVCQPPGTITTDEDLAPATVTGGDADGPIEIDIGVVNRYDCDRLLPLWYFELNQAVVRPAAVDPAGGCGADDDGDRLESALALLRTDDGIAGTLAADPAGDAPSGTVPAWIVAVSTVGAVLLVGGIGGTMYVRSERRKLAAERERRRTVREEKARRKAERRRRREERANARGGGGRRRGHDGGGEDEDGPALDASDQTDVSIPTDPAESATEADLEVLSAHMSAHSGSVSGSASGSDRDAAGVAAGADAAEAAIAVDADASHGSDRVDRSERSDGGGVDASERSDRSGRPPRDGADGAAGGKRARRGRRAAPARLESTGADSMDSELNRLYARRDSGDLTEDERAKARKREEIEAAVRRRRRERRKKRGSEADGEAAPSEAGAEDKGDAPGAEDRAKDPEGGRRRRTGRPIRKLASSLRKSAGRLVGASGEDGEDGGPARTDEAAAGGSPAEAAGPTAEGGPTAGGAPGPRRRRPALGAAMASVRGSFTGARASGGPGGSGPATPVPRKSKRPKKPKRGVPKGGGAPRGPPRRGLARGLSRRASLSSMTASIKGFVIGELSSEEEEEESSSDEEEGDDGGGGPDGGPAPPPAAGKVVPRTELECGAGDRVPVRVESAPPPPASEDPEAADEAAGGEPAAAAAVPEAGRHRPRRRREGGGGHRHRHGHRDGKHRGDEKADGHRKHRGEDRADGPASKRDSSRRHRAHESRRAGTTSRADHGKSDHRRERTERKADGRDGGGRKLDGSDRRLDNSDRKLDGSDRKLDGSDRKLDGSDRKLDNSDRKLDDRGGNGRQLARKDGSERRINQAHSAELHDSAITNTNAYIPQSLDGGRPSRPREARDRADSHPGSHRSGSRTRSNADSDASPARRRRSSDLEGSTQSIRKKRSSDLEDSTQSLQTRKRSSRRSRHEPHPPGTSGAPSSGGRAPSSSRGSNRDAGPRDGSGARKSAGPRPAKAAGSRRRSGMAKGRRSGSFKQLKSTLTSSFKNKKGLSDLAARALEDGGDGEGDGGAGDRRPPPATSSSRRETRSRRPGGGDGDGAAPGRGDGRTGRRKKRGDV